jgi:14-3-3 protein epsilon
MSNVNLENLSLQEEEGFVFDLEEGEEEVVDFRWCLVGRFLGDRSIHVNSMKVTMADIWRPVKGVKIKETTPGLFLFQFAHALDMEAVLHGGPWSFNNQMLILERVGLGVQIDNIPLYHVDFWVQVHNLPTGLMAERVGKTLANYIGSFVEYDKNNKGSFWREYMRIKVRVDIRQPLKKDSRVKNQGGAWCTVNFRYEKLGVFCFVCGILGHGENRCAVRFAMEEDDGSRGWSKELRADPRRRGGRQTSRWLTEEEGDKSEPLEYQSQSHVDNSEQVNPPHPIIPPTSPSPIRPAFIPQSLVGPQLVPHLIQNRNELSLATTSQPITCPVSASLMENNNNMQLILAKSMNKITSPLSQPTQAINALDKDFIDQSLPTNSQPITSLSFSPILSEALNQNNTHQFSFSASNVPTLKPQNNPAFRLTKNNPHQKTNRTGTHRPGPKIDPTKPVSEPTQTSPVLMEAQTEKKEGERRRRRPVIPIH